MSSPRRGLVLGAGGVLGAAWMIGALCALEEETDIDATKVDVLLGTSAGSVVAALLAAAPAAAEVCYTAAEMDAADTTNSIPSKGVSDQMGRLVTASRTPVYPAT